MKKIILVVLIAVATWWYFIGGRKMNEAHVTEFYRNLEAATLERKPDDLCALLADDFRSIGTAVIQGVKVTDENSKAETCEAYRELYAAWAKLGEKMGGMLQLDSDYEIHSISFSPDRKSATVDISSSLDVAGSITNIRSRSTDSLVRRNGKVMLIRSEGISSVSAGS